MAGSGAKPAGCCASNHSFFRKSIRIRGTGTSPAPKRDADRCFYTRLRCGRAMTAAAEGVKSRCLCFLGPFFSIRPTFFVLISAARFPKAHGTDNKKNGYLAEEKKP